MNHKILFVVLIFCVALFSCEKETEKVTLNADNALAPHIFSPVTNTSVVITEENMNEKLSISWDSANYTLNLPVTYELTVDSVGLGFAKNKATLTSTNKKTFSISYSDLNKVLLEQLKVPANKVSTIEIKVTAKLDNDQLPLTSALVVLKITSFKKVDVVYPEPAKIWIPGGYQLSGGDPSKSDALTMYSVFGTDSLKIFDGYLNFSSSCWIKFTPQAGWVPNWGGSNGSLVSDGAGIDISSAGYYHVRVNLKTMKYDVYKVSSFGIIGDATSGGWDNSTPMNYDAATKTWKVENVALKQGALKFRANNEWTLNYGPASSNSLNGAMVLDDPGAISIPANGNYDVTIDMSKSVGPFKDYTYKVVKR